MDRGAGVAAEKAERKGVIGGPTLQHGLAVSFRSPIRRISSRTAESSWPTRPSPEYCAQCHGCSGKGNGPAASGLDPKPAIHANIPFEKLPIDYLYNVINHGGAAMGKSPNMPYWNMTIGQQGGADVMAYLKVTFKGAPETGIASGGGAPSGVCPQPRKTATAPGEFLSKTNPLPASGDMVEAGKALFLQTAQPVACAV